MRNSAVRAGLAAALAVVALAACGGGSSTSSAAPAAATSTKAEDLRTDAAAVATGMKAISELATKIGEASAAQGKTLSEGIEPLWQPIEGTVQANSKETYDAYEGAFTLLESGDAAKAQEGARAVATATTAYLAKFPG
ncbi:hypothetical protein [Kineosporia sp. A_224]|uniref:hypothetical protein n=1 Tax=Kineosporia sp. A_224 TaxID=1962180 RepID=UPI000B4A6B1D|nr:hypothetical protein [Kineosporia sp. A_224]